MLRIYIYYIYIYLQGDLIKTVHSNINSDRLQLGFCKGTSDEDLLAAATCIDVPGEHNVLFSGFKCVV